MTNPLVKPNLVQESRPGYCEWAHIAADMVGWAHIYCYVALPNKNCITNEETKSHASKQIQSGGPIDYQWLYYVQLTDSSSA